MSEPIDRLDALSAGGRQASVTHESMVGFRVNKEISISGVMTLCVTVVSIVAGYMSIQGDTTRLKDDVQKLTHKMEVFSKGGEQVARLEERLGKISEDIGRLADRFDRILDRQSSKRGARNE